MTRKLHEYEKHIRDNHADAQGKAWCGAAIVLDWCFQDIDHAAMNGRNYGRLVPCPECRKAVIAALTNGAED